MRHLGQLAGYTRAEFLVVLTIIAILMAIMLPVFWRAVERAQALAG